MSQVFSGDCVQVAAGGSVPGVTETVVVTGNFVNPPFGNAKAVVLASVILTVGTGTTTINVRLRRNPNAENSQVSGSGTVNVTAGNIVVLPLQGADPIPDGRPVQYAVTVQQNGATGPGTIAAASIATFLISG